MSGLSDISKSRGQAVDHPLRLEVLRDTGLLDSLPDESMDRYTRLATALLGSEISLVTLVDRDRQFFKSQLGLGEPLQSTRETPLSHSFCKYVVEDGKPLVVEDAREDPRVCSNPAVTEFGVVSYLGTPLTTRDGFILGSLCVIGKMPRKWTPVDLERLSDLAGAVMREIELRELSRALKDALVAHEAEEEQHRARLRLMFEGLRSPMAKVCSCTEQLAGSAADFKPWQLDLLHRCQHSAKELLRATRAIEASELAEGEGIGPLEPEVISVSLLVRRAIRTMQPFADDADVRLDLKPPGDLLFLHADPAKVERVLIVLLTNAIQCSAAGAVVITQFERVEKSGCPMCMITISDQCGSVPDAEKRQIFHQFLKRPSLSARGGLMFCRKVLEAHGGDIRVTDVPGGGSAFHCCLPLVRMPVE